MLEPNKILINLSFLFLVSCVNIDSKDKTENKSSNGNVILPTFNTINVSNFDDVTLIKSDKCAIFLNNTEQPFSSFSIKNNSLIIEGEPDDLKANKKLTIYYQFIDSLFVKKVGSLNTEKTLSSESLFINFDNIGQSNLVVNTNTFELKGKNIGTVNISGSSLVSKINLQDVGNLKLKDLITKNDLYFKGTNIADGEIYSDKKLEILLDNSANFKVFGNPVDIKKNLSKNTNVSFE